MRRLHSRGLTLNHLPDMERQLALRERFAIFLDRGIFAALAFGKNRVLIAAGENGLEIDPAAMESAGDAGAFLALLPEPAHDALQLIDKTGALLGIFHKQRFQLGIADIVRGGPESLVAIPARFDQRVQRIRQRMSSVRCHEKANRVARVPRAYRVPRRPCQGMICLFRKTQAVGLGGVSRAHLWCGSCIRDSTPSRRKKHGRLAGCTSPARFAPAGGSIERGGMRHARSPMKLRRRLIAKLLKETFAAWSEHKVLRLSAALAYYAIFSIAPLLVIALAIAGSVFGQDAVRGQLEDQLRDAMGPDAAASIQSMIKSASRPADSIWATLLGFLTLFIGASGVFAQLKDALNTIWGVREENSGGLLRFLRERLLSFGMVLVIGFLLLASLGLTTALAAAGKYVGGVLPIHPFILALLGFFTSLGLVTVLFALIFKVLPDVSVQWRNVWIGAFATALMFEIGKFLLAFYLGRESTASSYGAAKSVILILLWIYYTSLILFTGAEFTRAQARATRTRIVPAGNAQAVTTEMRAKEGLPPAARPIVAAPPAPVQAVPRELLEVPAPQPDRPGRARPWLTVVIGLTLGAAAGFLSRKWQTRASR